MKSGKFNIADTKDYRLSLSLGVNGISYLITHGSQVLNIGSVALGEKADFSSLLKKDKVLSRDFKEVRVMMECHPSTIVPDRLFRAEDKVTYLSTTASVSPKSKTHSDFLPFNKSHNVYACPKDLMAVSKTAFPYGKFMHYSTALMLGWHYHHQTNGPTGIYIHIRNEQMDISLFNKGEMTIFNSFEYQTSGDFLYHVLLLYNRFSLDPKETPVFLSGEINIQGELYQRVYRYVNHISFTPIIKIWQFDDKFPAFGKHRFFDLFALASCEL